MLRRMFTGFVFAAVAIAGAGAASAQGLDGLHDQRVEGGRVCMSDHTHAGSGSGATRQLAEREAAASYTSFTALEYGDAWGSWRLAAGRTTNCSQSGGSWSCSIEARPCRPGGGGKVARRVRGKKN